MKFLEGKSPTEKKKIMAAGVLGALALLALAYTFSGIFFPARKTTVNVTTSPTPSPGASLRPIDTTFNQTSINSSWGITPLRYVPSNYGAPGAGRNIFAFYEPPAPTPYSPTPFVIKQTPTPATPTPTPPPPQTIAFYNPQMVYAGAKTFRLEVNGAGFTPDTRIIFNGSELPTNFVNDQKVTADVSGGLISAEGARMISTQAQGGKLYSNQVQLMVQAPPKPQYQYVGMIARRGYNNDTAYLMEPGKQTPMGVRLNDVIGGRFRAFSISRDAVILEDVQLGFKHRLPLATSGAPGGGTGDTGAAGGADTMRRGGGTFPNNGGGNVYMPNTQPNTVTGDIPGIPNNIPRYVPPSPQPTKQDYDDDGDNE
jgi:hypothetical protein